MYGGIETKIHASSLLLLFSWMSKSSANVLTDIPKSNPLNIDWDPAPSPEDGPPLSAGALRDKSLLPAEIGGILGAYIFVVILVGIALVVVGRKLRLSTQRAAKALDIEMVDPKVFANIDTSPISPGGHPTSPRNFSWPSPVSPEKDSKNPYVFPSTGKSPTTPPGTDPYVDARVVEADQEMMQRDLEDLYAHVMEQEELKRAGADVKELPPPPQLQRAPVPAEAPQRQASPSKKSLKDRPSNLTLDEPKQKSHSRTSSIISSLKSPRRKGIKGIRISSPIPTPVSGTFPGNASDEEPLTPRYYNPPPPPPVPTDQAPYTHARNRSSGGSIASELSPHIDSRIDARHRPNLSQTSMMSAYRVDPGSAVSSKDDPNSATSATSQTPLFSERKVHAISPPPLQFASQNPYAQHQTSAQSSTRALPLRQFEPALTSPSFVSTSTKTTVLERTAPVGGHGPQTGGLRTPWSAGAVPYSPYMPFTPVMPITPRLVTKEERKAKKRAQGRTPVLEMIKGEDELWDSGY